MSALVEQIDALLALNAKGAVSHPVPGLAVELLEDARNELAALSASDHAGLVKRLGALSYHISQTGMADATDAATCLEAATALSAGVRVRLDPTDLPVPDDGLEVVARLGGINGVKLQRHIEAMRPEAQAEYAMQEGLVRFSDAQAALQSQAEQIERLTRIIEVMGKVRDEKSLATEAAEQQVQKLTAENERLREALYLIDALDPEEHIYGVSHDACRGLIIRMGQVARSALETQEGGK